MVERVPCRGRIQGRAVARGQGRACVGVAQEAVSGSLKASWFVDRWL